MVFLTEVSIGLTWTAAALTSLFDMKNGSSVFQLLDRQVDELPGNLPLLGERTVHHILPTINHIQLVRVDLETYTLTRDIVRRDQVGVLLVYDLEGFIDQLLIRYVVFRLESHAERLRTRVSDLLKNLGSRLELQVYTGSVAGLDLLRRDCCWGIVGGSACGKDNVRLRLPEFLFDSLQEIASALNPDRLDTRRWRQDSRTQYQRRVRASPSNLLSNSRAHLSRTPVGYDPHRSYVLHRRTGRI